MKKAREEDKPIFLSVGYSTCYWCHVMEREVFEDGAIARIMNESMVNIKVDREERPDVDRVYMGALIATTGQGGWPMSVFLTPDLKPFYAATYIRPVAHHGMPGFPDLVRKISELWRNDRDKIETTGRQIIDHLRSGPGPSGHSASDETVLEKGYGQILKGYDPKHGGFGSGPKFPRPSVFNFLLRYFKRTGNGSSLKMVLNTLRAMGRGGINDQMGGGFHRYSVDGEWRLPHFEKMLYDQAQLSLSYLEAYQITKDDSLIQTAQSTLDYVLNRLQHAPGGFYSAEDAESIIDISRPDEKAEGAFYVWKKSEIESILGKNYSDIFNYHFGVADGGNAIQDHQNAFYGQNILHAAHTIEETASEFGVQPSEIALSLTASRQKLYLEREKRPRPHLDDKIITGWNGLMISAFAKAFQILRRDLYLKTAESAAHFVLNNLYDPDTKTLYRRYRDGNARFDGGLQDYAFLIQGLTDLYESSFNPEWLEQAVALSHKQIELFWDDKDHGFFDSHGNDPSILVRTKEGYDGAEPAGNSVAALNFLRLADITNNLGWREIADKTIRAFGEALSQTPEALPQMLVALGRKLSAPKEIIIAGDRTGQDTWEMIRVIQGHFLPDKIILLLDDQFRNKFTKYLPFIEHLEMVEEKATAFICRNYACQLPATEIGKIEEMLEEGS